MNLKLGIRMPLLCVIGLATFFCACLYYHDQRNNFFLTASSTEAGPQGIFKIASLVSCLLFFFFGYPGAYASVFAFAGALLFALRHDWNMHCERIAALLLLPFFVSFYVAFHQQEPLRSSAGGACGALFVLWCGPHLTFVGSMVNLVMLLLLVLIYRFAYTELLFFPIYWCAISLRFPLFIAAFFVRLHAVGLFCFQVILNKGLFFLGYCLPRQSDQSAMTMKKDNQIAPVVYAVQDSLMNLAILDGGYHQCHQAAHFATTILSEQSQQLSVNQIAEKSLMLEKKLSCFGVDGKVIKAHVGPLLILFEYQPHIDIKLSKIVALEDDLAMALESTSTRILAPIPGRAVVGFEIAHQFKKSVLFGDVFSASVYQDSEFLLPLILGVDTLGHGVVIDLVKLPHLLLAGSTGSGKSVLLQSMLLSLLAKKDYHGMKLILIDPKRLEFTMFASTPHLLFPIVSEAQKAVAVLTWVVKEMERRYEKMALYGARNLVEFNLLKPKTEETLPFIVLVIDEFADLILTAGKELEILIVRIAQMARASGIHLIIATQRPSVDVITGIIKANFPARIALRVASRIDSRTVLDRSGAELLLAKGDMLFLNPSQVGLQRIHGPFISSDELKHFLACICATAQPNYVDLTFESECGDNQIQEDVVLYNAILDFVKQEQAISISLLQRKFKIGYNRSARLIELLEQKGIITPMDGSKLRRVIR